MVINLLKVQPQHPADAKQRSRRARTVTLMYFSAFLSLIVTAASYAQTLKYTYDALGRVTYVVDDLNGNRDYDYDAAGNRRNVAVGTGSDAQVEPVAISNPSNLPSPTNLSYVQGSFCVYDVSWTLVPLADRYVLTDSTQKQFIATGSSYPINSCSGAGQVTIKPSKIKACVGASCGPEAFFPANPVAPPPPPPSPIPSAPTGLSSATPGMCQGRASWNASTNATSYIVRFPSGTQTVTTTFATYGCTSGTTVTKPDGVRACNAAGCSSESLFP